MFGRLMFSAFPSFEPPQPRLRLQLRPAIDLLVWALLVLLLLVSFATTPARAQGANTIFLTDKNGQIPFPILPPNRATGAAGSIDNMTIGQTTPRPGKFTTLQADSIVLADGVTCASYVMIGAGAATDTVFFVATRAYRVVSISAIFSAQAGGASALQVTKDTGTQAPGAGTDLLTNNTNAGFDLNGTANTVQTGTLVTTAGVTTLAAGNRLAVDFAQAIQSTAGLTVTACMSPQ